MTTLCETKYPLCMIAGTTFSRTFVLRDSGGVPMDLTGYTAEIHIRGKVADDVELIDCTLPRKSISVAKLRTTWN